MVDDARRRAVPAGRRGELRKNLARQIKRMLDDPRSEALTRNFVGQWLQVRDVEGFTINTRAVLRQEGSRRQDRPGRPRLRRAMRGETEMAFGYIVREDRSVLELIDSDYTFLNAKLAELYGIKGVERQRDAQGLAAARTARAGGVLTHASILAGHLEPDPDLAGEAGPVHPGQPPGHAGAASAGGRAPLEESKKDFKDREPTGRELMALHRAQAAVQLVPCADGPAGPGAGELQRAGPVARQGERAADRFLGQADHAASRSTTFAT